MTTMISTTTTVGTMPMVSHRLVKVSLKAKLKAKVMVTMATMTSRKSYDVSY